MKLPKDMTTGAILNKCAKLMGWTREESGSDWYDCEWHHPKHERICVDAGSENHPLPFTLDAISEAMETHAKGWNLQLRYERTACRESPPWIAEAWVPGAIADTLLVSASDAEKRARLELLLLVLRIEAEKKNEVKRD